MYIYSAQELSHRDNKDLFNCILTPMITLCPTIMDSMVLEMALQFQKHIVNTVGLSDVNHSPIVNMYP